jgi:hypothetical protein
MFAAFYRNTEQIQQKNKHETPETPELDSSTSSHEFAVAPRAKVRAFPSSHRALLLTNCVGVTHAQAAEAASIVRT